MKRYFALFCSCLLILFLGYTQEQGKLKEEVTVTAVEVPVRVLAHGSPVKNLTRDDFEVYENGVRQTITDFEVHSKTIRYLRFTKTTKEPGRNIESSFSLQI